MHSTTSVDASDVVDDALNPKPDLVIHSGDLPATADALRDLLARADYLFDRGIPVRIAIPPDGSPPAAHPLTTHGVTRETHRLCRPVRIDGGERKPVTLPERVALIYLDMKGEWKLRPLAGVTTAPLLTAEGEIRSAQGYDPETDLWSCAVPAVCVLPRPTLSEVKTALRELRMAFCTFPFADSPRRWDQNHCIDLVDIEKTPGHDESAFLLALMTAVCRASLWLAPGFLLTAPAISGAGNGKGLLVRAICAIAFGVRPRAFTAGRDRAELDKRLAAELMEAQPALYLDNVNATVLRSDTLASVLTERPARVRILGESRMVPLNSTAFIAVTGNGLTVTEDLARRFISSSLDAKCEDPELRSFPAGFIDEIERRRADLLGAVLTIWRWGRQNVSDLTRGLALGSYETWSEWCRDPLLTLGCRDPVERIAVLKANDPQRQLLRELFGAWWESHQDAPIKASDLSQRVTDILDPQGRGRQYCARRLAGLANTRAAGFVLTRQDPAGKWSAATYALMKTREATGADKNGPDANDIGHRTNRADREKGGYQTPPDGSMSPMNPMPYVINGGPQNQQAESAKDANLRTQSSGAEPNPDPARCSRCGDSSGVLKPYLVRMPDGIERSAMLHPECHFALAKRAQKGATASGGGTP
jgi:hypothetical protein